MDRYTLLDKIGPIKHWITEVRRDFHSHPELGMEEFRTMEQICNYLDEMNIKYVKNIANTGIVADIPGVDPSFTVALRADMDALPITDLKNTSYTSKNIGKCHACGHDAHMAIQLGVAKFFAENKIIPPFNLKLLFQPAEETVGGAKPMIIAGALENVDVIYGLHVDDSLEVGKIGIKYGAMNASSDTLKINIFGKSCHGAYPSNGVDAILIASHVIVALQSIVSRNIDARDSGVITIGKINGGTQGNIVANKVELIGTLRTLDSSVRETMLKRIDEIVTNIPLAFGGNGEFIREEGYTSLINHDKYVDLIKKNALFLLGENSIYEKKLANMGVEDFAYFLEKVPGAFFTLGIKNKNITCTAHNGNFDIDEEALIYGVAIQLLNIYNSKKL